MFLDKLAIRRRYSEFKIEKRSMLMRLKQDIADLDLPDELEVAFPIQSDITHMVIKYTADASSLWHNLPVTFALDIPVSYPFNPPKIICLSHSFHPNISPSGVVCLNTVREEWKPSYTLNHVLQGVISLFYSPSTDDPLNEQAANPITFREHCLKTFNLALNSSTDLCHN